MRGRAAPVRPLWQGRVLAFAGILLVALNLRTAVTALSPILAEITHDVPFGAVGIGVLGALPPFCFAVFGLIAPLFTRRMSLEMIVLVAVLAIAGGDLLRAAAPSYALLVAGSMIAFAGMAVGNVLLPPLVKRYFPDHVGLMTSLYATLLSLSTLTPPLVAVPVTAAVGWRNSVGLWSIVSLVAALPWLAVLVRRPEARHVNAGVDPGARAMRWVWRAPLAWAMAVVFAVSSLNAYALFAWLPELLHDLAGTDAAQAGALLSLYAGVGIPASLLIPALASRLRNVAWLVYLGVGFFVVGDLGLLLTPGAVTWLWVMLAGFGPLLFPLCLVLINLRTRTHEGSVALSGFVQGLGYVLGALGPITVGALHSASGGWRWPLIFLLATAGAVIFAGRVVARPGMLEDWAAGGRRGHGPAYVPPDAPSPSGGPRPEPPDPQGKTGVFPSDGAGAAT